MDAPLTLSLTEKKTFTVNKITITQALSQKKNSDKNIYRHKLLVTIN